MAMKQETSRALARVILSSLYIMEGKIISKLKWNFVGVRKTLFSVYFEMKGYADSWTKQSGAENHNKSRVNARCAKR